MSISYEDGGNVRTIRIMGRLDVEGTGSVADQLVKLATEAQKSVVVDLSPLKFLASIGIRALITSAKAVKERGGKMVLVVKPGSTVQMSIKATGVDQFVPVFGNGEDAAKAAAA